MKALNLGWMLLAVLAGLCPLAMQALWVAAVWIPLLAWHGRGPGLFLWVLAVGGIEVWGQPEPTWIPLLLGALAGAYNLGGIRPFTPAAALSQAVLVLAPVPGLVLRSSWEAIPFGLGGICLAAFCAASISSLIHLYEIDGIFEPEILRPHLSKWLDA